MRKEIVLLAVAGATGTIARYFISSLIQRACGNHFPWGTVTVNMLGCLLFGLVWSLTDHRLLISAQTRFLLLTGFMGAFTTFSTFAFETIGLLQTSHWWHAIGNGLGQLIAGVLFILLGLALGRLF